MTEPTDEEIARQIARPVEEWHEDIGDVLWWKFPVEESPYVGSPLDVGHTVEITVRAHGVDKVMRVNIGGWPGYHTHWTPIVIPTIRETDSDA